MTHIGIIGKLTQNENNIFDLIRNVYGGGSPTSNVYAVEGIAAFGIWGIFFSTFLIILLSKIISLFVCEMNKKISLSNFNLPSYLYGEYTFFY